MPMKTRLLHSINIGRNRRGPRRFTGQTVHVAKRLECVQLAGAFGSAWGCGKREQAPRTPNASRDFVAARPRCAVSPICNRQAVEKFRAHPLVAAVRRMQFCDTADCKSAL